MKVEHARVKLVMKEEAWVGSRWRRKLDRACDEGGCLNEACDNRRSSGKGKARDGGEARVKLVTIQEAQMELAQRWKARTKYREMVKRL